MPETPPPPSPAITTVAVPPPTQPSSTGNKISTTLSTFRALFARRNDFRYSLPVVVFDTIWNLAFVVISAVMLILTAKEKPDVLHRFWLAGRMLNCVVYVVQMLLDYNRRHRRAAVDSENLNSSNSTSNGFRFLRRLGVLYAFSFYEYWWNVGLIWMVLDGETFKHDSPRLYWFTYAVLAPDVFFGLIRYYSVLFSSFPLRHQRGASTAEIGVLPKYSFEVSNDEKEPDGKAQRMVSVGTKSPALSFVSVLHEDSEFVPEADTSIFPKYRFEVSNDKEQSDGTACRMVPMQTNGPDFSVERALPTKDVDCCICFCHYEDGAELHLLPCNHHFHTACLEKWIRVKAACPLCKYIIDPIEQV